jgi:hypothetical protein
MNTLRFTIIKIILSFSERIKVNIRKFKNNPSSEEKTLALWSESIRNLSDFFFQKFERKNNKKLYKISV